MSFSLRGLNHTARDTFLGGKVTRFKGNIGGEKRSEFLFLEANAIIGDRERVFGEVYGHP